MVNPEINGELPSFGSHHFTIERTHPEQKTIAPSPIDVRVHPLLEGDGTLNALLEREARMLRGSRNPVIAYQHAPDGECIVLIDRQKLVGPVQVQAQTVTWNGTPVQSDSFSEDRLDELRHPHGENAPFSHVLRVSLRPVNGNLSRVVITGNEQSRMGPTPTRVVVEESRLRPIHLINAAVDSRLRQ